MKDKFSYIKLFFVLHVSLLMKAPQKYVRTLTDTKKFPQETFFRRVDILEGKTKDVLEKLSNLTYLSSKTAN